MRYLLALLILLAGAAGGILVYRHVTAGLPVNIVPPQRLVASTAGTPLLVNGWTNSPTVLLSADNPPKVAAGVDVEVRRQGHPFSNVATSSNLIAHAGDPGIQVHLADGRYHWQVRLHNRDGLSPWVPYRGTISVDTQPPAAPTISSTTDPDPARTYHRSTLDFSWQTQDSGSGIAGYSYRLDTDPKGLPKQALLSASPTDKRAGLSTGVYYFHVAARDNAGNWSQPSTFPVHIDVTPPGLSSVRFSLFQFNPQVDSLGVSFGVTRPAPAIHVGVYRQSDHTLVRLYTLSSLAKGQKIAVSWDGKDAEGHFVPAGNYQVYIRATDQYGHSSLQGWNDFIVEYQRIVVSLSQQKLVAYDGNQVFLTSLVTSGNQELPTPTGTYHILGKFHPFTFHSPWPKGSQYYYAPSKTNYAMLFQDQGYFIHDAPWRTAYGPGTNAQQGAPGSNYTGTHGCVNVPFDVAQRLFGWAQIGTVVEIDR